MDVAIPIAAASDYRAADRKGVLTRIDIILKQSKFEELKDAMNDIGVTGKKKLLLFLQNHTLNYQIFLT